MNTDTIQFADEFEQPEFINLAEILLGTEPKFAMTAPKAGWLLNWFLVSIVLGWVTAPLLSVGCNRMLPRLSARPVFLSFVFLAGAMGTTVAGRWYGVFYFSWPICLFVVFECVVCHLQSSDKSVKPRPWLARFWLLSFVAICYCYFWLCRRLSLAFEWTFLLGFPAAIPFLWLVKSGVQRDEKFSIKQWFLSAVAFSVFYWVGAAVIMWKYPI